MAGWACGGGALALSSLPAVAQTSDLEDFEDVLVIGEGRPTEIGHIDGPTVIGAVDEDGNLIVEDLPEQRLEFQAVNGDFELAKSAYQSGDMATALREARLVGDSGNAQAQMLAGLILVRGLTGSPDADEGVVRLRSAADGGDLDALLLLGELAADGKAGLSPAQARGFFARAAAQGDAKAKLALAALSARENADRIAADSAGESFPRIPEPDLGEDLYARAVSLRETDPVEAFGLFSKAAAKGHAPAAYEAAILQVTNYDLPPDEARAAELMRQAAEGGVPEAMADYGLMIYQGAGVPQDETQAATWFRKAAQAGDKEGQFLWAFTLAKGEGVAQNYEEAYYWLLKSGGDSGVGEYDASRRQLRERLEQNVDPATLERARNRYDQSGGFGG